MSEHVVVRARVSGDVKEAAAVLAEIGLTVSDLVAMTLTRVARDKALPFDLAPNAEMIASIEASERGEGLHRAASLDDLIEKLRM